MLASQVLAKLSRNITEASARATQERFERYRAACQESFIGG